MSEDTPVLSYLEDFQQDKTPLSEIRERASRYVEGITDPLEKRYRTEWRVFVTMNPDQITRESIQMYLEVAEPYLREQANQLLYQKGDDISIALSAYYNMWEEMSLALDGLKGKEPISKTIDYFRRDAAVWTKFSDEDRLILVNGGPFRTDNFIRETKMINDRIIIHDKVAKNMNAAARVLEIPPLDFVVPSDQQ